MAYFAQSDIEPLIPPAWLVEGLDDDGDGSQDAFTAVQTAVENLVNGMLALRYEVPITVSGNAGLTAFFTALCSHWAAEMIYARRGQQEAFPHAATLKALRDRFDAIVSGREPLNISTERHESAIAVISEDSRIHSTRANV
jgi:hypothetical protein